MNDGIYFYGLFTVGKFPFKIYVAKHLFQEAFVEPLEAFQHLGNIVTNKENEFVLVNPTSNFEFIYDIAFLFGFRNQREPSLYGRCVRIHSFYRGLTNLNKAWRDYVPEQYTNTFINGHQKEKTGELKIEQKLLGEEEILRKNSPDLAGYIATWPEDITKFQPIIRNPLNMKWNYKKGKVEKPFYNYVD